MSKQHHPVGRVSAQRVTRQDAYPPAHKDVGLRFANPTYEATPVMLITFITTLSNMGWQHRQ